MMTETTPIFLSHTSADKPSVLRFFEALRHYAGIDSWLDSHRLLPGDDLLGTITQAVAESSHVIVFWSRNALQKYEAAGAVGDLSWIAVEIRTALEALRRMNRKLISVRLDDSPWPTELMAHFAQRKWIDAIGLLDKTRKDQDLIVWRAATEIVGSLRGRAPIYPTRDLFANGVGEPLKIGISYYFDHTWIGGHDEARSGVNYIDAWEVHDEEGHRGTIVPAVKGADTSFAYRFSIPNHTARGWWSAAISFGMGDPGWRTVDLRKYKEMRFIARASDAGAPLAVSFTDNDQGSKTPSGHQESSQKIFRLGAVWRAGAPWVLNLDELDWSRNGFPGNTQDVNRAEILQIVFNNGWQPWEPGTRWIEVKNVVLL